MTRSHHHDLPVALAAESLYTVVQVGTLPAPAAACHGDFVLVVCGPALTRKLNFRVKFKWPVTSLPQAGAAAQLPPLLPQPGRGGSLRLARAAGAGPGLELDLG